MGKIKIAELGNNGTYESRQQRSQAAAVRAQKSLTHPFRSNLQELRPWAALRGPHQGGWWVEPTHTTYIWQYSCTKTGPYEGPLRFPLASPDSVLSKGSGQLGIALQHTFKWVKNLSFQTKTLTFSSHTSHIQWWTDTRGMWPNWHTWLVAAARDTHRDSTGLQHFPDFWRFKRQRGVGEHSCNPST